MGVSWSSPRSLRPVSPRVARDQPFRRLVPRSVSFSFVGLRRGPEFSEWRGALDALQQLHTVAGDGSLTSQGVPVPSPALTSGSRRTPRLLAAPALRRDPVPYDGRRWL